MLKGHVWFPKHNTAFKGDSPNYSCEAGLARGQANLMYWNYMLKRHVWCQKHNTAFKGMSAKYNYSREAVLARDQANFYKKSHPYGRRHDAFGGVR
jgi:hypothetical protein